MSSRYSGAKPTTASDAYAHTHHANTNESSVRFDVRNPSALAPAGDADDEPDAFLDADVIRGGTSTKRGAVNIDGYDSDSDNDDFNAKAQRRKGGEVDLEAKFKEYEEGGAAAGKSTKKQKTSGDDEDDFDMFGGGNDEEDGQGADGKENADYHANGKKKKDVRFVDASTLVDGQVDESRGGGHIHLNDESSDDDDDKQLAAAEEDLDPEIGAGGSKRNAPKLEAFNLKQEQEEGRFDESGNYVRQAAEVGAEHDKWLDGMSKKEMKKAAEAHERRQAEAEKLRRQEDELLTEELLAALIRRLERGETPLEALARLGKVTKKTKTSTKKIPAWKLKKMRGKTGEMDVDASGKGKNAADPVDAEAAAAKESIDTITEAADKLLSRDHAEIYDEERELLVRQWQRETGKDWVEETKKVEEETVPNGDKMWEFRWSDGRDGGAKQGPYDRKTMKVWQDAGYFAEGVEFKLEGQEGGWTRVADFV